MPIQRLLVLAALSTAAVFAQQPTDPQALEAALHARAVAVYNAAADAVDEQKQWARALELRRELLAEYDPDDAHAREKCGFVKVGANWQRDADKLVMETNGSGDKRALQKMEKQWQKDLQELIQLHEQLAKAWGAAGNKTKAARHLQRLLHFRPGDAALIGALQLHDFEDFLGSERDLLLLRRSRLCRFAVDYLKQLDVPVQRLDGEQLPLLQRAKVTHIGVQSQHFTVWGSLPEAQLLQAAQYAERSLLLARALFAVCDGARFQPAQVRDIVYVPDQASYSAVLHACQDQFDAERLQFLEGQVDLFYPQDGERTLRCYKAVHGLPEVLDLAVRGVVQDALGVSTDGMWEGTGHAFCGLFFDQTLAFMVEQQAAHTVTQWHKKPLRPDMKVWREIAAETAWGRGDTPTAQLVLLQAARFTNEERVKAWSMVDWFLRWRPELVMELDRCKTDRIRTQPEVEAEFARRTGLVLADLDGEWRDFWTKDKALREAIEAPPQGSKSGLAAAAVLGKAVDDARVAAQLGPIGWYVADTAVTKAGMQWLAERARAKTPPQLPPELQRAGLLHAGKDAGAAVAAWLADPSARDALLQPGRVLLGFASSKAGVVVELGEPCTPVQKGLPLAYPGEGQREVPLAVRAGDLGALAAAALQAQGTKADDRVGYPLTLHFFRPLPANQLPQVACRVLDGVHPLDGVVIPLQGDGALDGSLDGAAAGCFTFVPLEPLPPGVELEVRWTLPFGALPRDGRFPSVTFRTAAK